MTSMKFFISDAILRNNRVTVLAPGPRGGRKINHLQVAHCRELTKWNPVSGWWKHAAALRTILTLIDRRVKPLMQQRVSMTTGGQWTKFIKHQKPNSIHISTDSETSCIHTCNDSYCGVSRVFNHHKQHSVAPFWRKWKLHEHTF